MDPPVPDRAAACADRLQAADEVLLASHIDADGRTNATVVASALEDAGIPHEVVFTNGSTPRKSPASRRPTTTPCCSPPC